MAGDQAFADGEAWRAGRYGCSFHGPGHAQRSGSCERVAPHRGRAIGAADLEPPCSSSTEANVNTPTAPWLREAEVRAFARALRIVFKSDSWEYVSEQAAEAWSTGSSVPWDEVAAEVRIAWTKSAAA